MRGGQDAMGGDELTPDGKSQSFEGQDPAISLRCAIDTNSCQIFEYILAVGTPLY